MAVPPVRRMLLLALGSQLGMSAVASGATPEPSYSGYGAQSVPPKVLARYAPPPLEPDLQRKIHTMLDIRAPGLGQVSPDGSKLYFNWTITGVTHVWRIDGPQRFPVQMTGGADLTALSGISPDGRYLVISRDRGGEENPGLYIQNAQGGPLHPIQHKKNIQTFFQFITDDSRTVYYKANDLDSASYALYRYDVQADKAQLLYSQAGLWNIDDYQQDGRLLLGKATGNLSREYYEWDPPTAKLTPLFGQGEQEDYESQYGAHPGELIVLTQKFGEFRRLYRWQAGIFTPLTPEMKKDVADFAIDKRRQRILYQVNDGGYTRIAGMDAVSFKPLALPSFPEADHVLFGATSRDGRYTALGAEMARAPRTNYVYDWQQRKLTQWVLPSAPEVDTGRFVTAQLDYYPARDGTSIPMFVRQPATCDGPCPVIVDFHGGPEGQSVPGFNIFAQIFVDAGFVFVQPNVRGSEGYGKAWLHADDGPKRLQVITDIEDCARYIKSHWVKDGRTPRVGIMGGSYGGYSTLMGMTYFGGTYDAGVASFGISNLRTFLLNTAPYRRPLRITEYGDPEKDKEALIQLSPITYVDRVRDPLLIIAGPTTRARRRGRPSRSARPCGPAKPPPSLSCSKTRDTGPGNVSTRCWSSGTRSGFSRLTCRVSSNRRLPGLHRWDQRYLVQQAKQEAA